MSASDIAKSFTYLHDNIPRWFTNLTDMEANVASIQNEITKVPISRSPPMLKRKTGSTESLRDTPMAVIPEEQSTAGPTQQNSIQATRKRKTPSVASERASGPSKYRSRSMVVVQYDGNIQKAFESMVRDIGTGRNLLRKAKMAAKMQALADIASDSSEDEDADPMLAKIGYRRRTGLSSIRAARTRDSLRSSQSEGNASPELFDRSDKYLEQAQSLCETAAHRSLRDGDCRKELAGVRKHLEAVLDIAIREVTAAQARKEAEVKSEEISNDPSKIEPLPSPIEIEPQPSKYPSLPTPPLTLKTSKTMEIEVDDEDDDEDYVMPPIRLTSRV